LHLPGYQSPRQRAGYDQAGDFTVFCSGAPDSASTGGGLHIGSNNVYVAKLNFDGSKLLYSATFGGSLQDYAYFGAVDDAGNAYIAGTTYSSDFPTTSNAFIKTFPFSTAGASFLAKISADGTSFVYSTFGVPEEQLNALSLNAIGEAQVAYTDLSSSIGVRRYDTEGSAIRFDTSLGIKRKVKTYAPNNLMSIDGAGYTTLLGSTVHINMPVDARQHRVSD
jgi:hypothetical protein